MTEVLETGLYFAFCCLFCIGGMDVPELLWCGATELTVEVGLGILIPHGRGFCGLDTLLY